VSEDSPFETLHAYVQDAINPFFNSFVQQSRREESESDKLVTSVQKNMNELAVGLLHLQQNIAIPEISLPIHPIIAKAVEKAAEADRKPLVEDVQEHISDATFLNFLQKQVALWTKEIRKVTTMQRDVSSGTALQEVSFWINMEHALMRVRNKRESPEVVLTLEVLKAGKRFHTTLSFDSDTGLRTIQDRVTDYNILMKDFPLKELLAADSLLVIEDVIKNSIFTHLKKIRHTNYPTERAVGLVEAISRDLLNQLLKCLSTHKLMIVTYKEFEEVNLAVVKVFTTWDEQFEMFTTQLRDLAKKKKGETMKFHFKYNLMHKKLEARFVQLKEFRHQHEQLQSVICRVLKLAQQAKSLKQQGASTPASNDIMSGEEQLLDEEEFLAVKEVRLAYDNVKVVDCLDLSADGTASWDTALKRYEERIDRVETRIAARLRDQLGSARNANEMFRIFSRYNSLFIRPHIRGAIREYQAQLMQRVKEDIEKLHVKFKMQYNKTHTYALCSMLDIPPISSSIMWARQLEHQLQMYLNRVEAVLGPDWGTHIEGQHLKAYADSLKLKLDPSPLFEDWKKKVENKQMVQGKIFDITSQRGKSGSFLKLLINFNEDTISLYKEVRNLRAMNFRIPFSVSSMATQANQLYPHAVCLKESIRTYEQTCQKVSCDCHVIIASCHVTFRSVIMIV
jgi:dynein heavy chain 1